MARLSFTADYPWAIVYPADSNNYYHAGVAPYYHSENQPRGFVLHTPEEPAGDNYPGTPIWFAKDLLTEYGYQATTHYFVEAIEDPKRPGYTKVYQCVPERDGAVANGVLGKPYPAWASRSTSLNWQSLSVEIEGFAGSIDRTLTPMQLKTVAHLVAHRAAHYGFATDRQHVIGHYEVATNRTDPGPKFPWGELMRLLNEEPEEEDEMKAHPATAGWFGGRPFGASEDIYTMQTASDFGLPADAQAVMFQVIVDSGEVEFYHGNTDIPCAKLGSDTLIGNLHDGTLNFRSRKGVLFREIQCVGYFR